MQTPSKLPLVLVTWEDANTGGDDAVSLDNIDAYHKVTLVHTLGWLLKQDDRGVTIVTEFYDSMFRGRTFIPAKMIMSITPYNLSTPRRKQAKNAESTDNQSNTDSGSGG